MTLKAGFWQKKDFNINMIEKLYFNVIFQKFIPLNRRVYQLRGESLESLAAPNYVVAVCTCNVIQTVL